VTTGTPEGLVARPIPDSAYFEVTLDEEHMASLPASARRYATRTIAGDNGRPQAFIVVDDDFNVTFQREEGDAGPRPDFNALTAERLIQSARDTYRLLVRNRASMAMQAERAEEERARAEHRAR